MKLKQLVSVGLLSAMVMAMLSGCGDTNNEVASNVTETASIVETVASDAVEGKGEEIVFPLEETMKVSVLGMYCGTWPLSEGNLAWDYMQEMANIEAEVLDVPLAEISEKGSLIMASGDYPEVLFKCPHLPLDDYGKEGILIPLEDLIKKYMPNLSALLDEGNYWSALRAADGNIYSLPLVGNKVLASGSNNVYWINQRWLDNVGMKMPTSKEELYDVLKAFKEQDANGNGDPNDEIPFAFQDGDTDRLNYWLHEEEDYRLLKNNFIITKDGELEFYPTTNEYKNDYLEYVKKLYDEELIDHNSFTMNREQLTAISMNADVLGMTMNASLRFAPEDWLYDFVVLPSFNEEGISLNNGLSKGGLAITDKCENPEVILAWFDYLYAKGNSDLAYLGVEGVSYEKNADGTYSKLGKWENFNYQCTFVGGAAFPAIQSDLINKPSPESDKATYITNAEMFGDELFGSGVVVPTLLFTEDETETLSTLETDISNYISTYRAQVITGEISLEDTWQNFQDTLVKMNVDKLISIYKNAYARAITE